MMVFIRNKEDFVCENCKFKNEGNGYTNHCQKCLYSKHVDIGPGDRLNDCRSLMEPIHVSYTNNNRFIVHKCLKCNFEKKNIINNFDSVETMIGIQKNKGL